MIDERAAGFMALGMAKASGRPAVVTCTSGTAAANLAPAVHEAWQARVPLVVLTADRPPELRDVGAGQAIDQIGLYGSAAKWFVELGNERARAADWNAHVRATACRAWFTAAGGRPGPVHVNLPLREPLAPAPEDLAADDWQGRPGGAPWTRVREHGQAPDGDDVQALAGRMAEAPRGVMVCGGGAGDVAEQVTRLARQAGWPVLADALSGVRCGQHDLSHVVAHYDVLLRDEGFAGSHAPDLVLRVGDTPTSKPCAPGWTACTRRCLTPSARGTIRLGRWTRCWRPIRPPRATRWPRRWRCSAGPATRRGWARGGRPTRSCRPPWPRRPTRSSPRSTRRWRASCPRARRCG